MNTRNVMNTNNTTNTCNNIMNNFSNNTMKPTTTWHSSQTQWTLPTKRWTNIFENLRTWWIMWTYNFISHVGEATFP